MYRLKFTKMRETRDKTPTATCNFISRMVVGGAMTENLQTISLLLYTHSLSKLASNNGIEKTKKK